MKGMKKDKKGWYYSCSDRTYAKNEWEYIE